MWPVDLAHAVQSFELTEDGRVDKVKLWPKTAALEALARYRAMFVDRQIVDVNIQTIKYEVVDSVIESSPVSSPEQIQSSNPLITLDK